MNEGEEPFLERADLEQGRVNNEAGENRAVAAETQDLIDQNVFCLGLCLLFMLMFAFGLVLYFQSRITKNVMFLVPLVYACYKACRLGLYGWAYARIQLPSSELVYRMCLLRAGGLLLYALGWMGYAVGLWSTVVVTALAVPLIVVNVAGLANVILQGGPSGEALLNFFETVQLGFLPNVYGQAEAGEEWLTGFWFYATGGFVSGLLSKFLLGFLLILVINLAISLSRLNNAQLRDSIFIMCLVYYASAFLALVKDITVWFQAALAVKAFSPQFDPSGLPPDSRELGAFVAQFFATFSIFGFFIYFKIVRPALLRGGRRTRILSFETLPELIQSNYSQISETFFAVKNPDAEQPLRASLGQESTCSICIDRLSDTILEPCGHGGFCKDCLTQWIRKQPICPLCKVEVKRVEIVARDLESKHLMVKGFINIAQPPPPPL